MSTEQTPTTPWHVTACVHQPITPAQADGLFDTLADAAHGWEPTGVDVDVSGGPCYCRQSPSGPSFGAALGTILGASGGASQAGEDQAGVDRAVRDALRHIGYDGPPADPRSPDETQETHGFDAGDPDLDVSLPRLSRPIRRLLLVSPAVARVVDAAREVARVLRPAVSRPSRALVAAVDALDTDADPATERDFDAAAAAAVPVTVVGTRPPWHVHDSPPPTHGTPGAEPVTGAGWNNRTWATELIAAAREPVHGVEPVFVADDADYLEALLADRDRLRQRLADSIDPANIPDQRAKNWPDWHPEKYCHRCGQPNINWYADSAIWNEVHGGSGPIWCPVCFARAYEQTTARRVSWRLAPVEKSDQLGHLIRSEAAMRHERDAARAELATARRDAAADALLMVRQRFEESTTDGNIDTGWWLMWLEAWAAEVRTGQRTIIPQSATTPDDLPEWERDMLDRQEET
jgi:hypothetical protein